MGTATQAEPAAGKPDPRRRVLLHPLPVRLAHWTFALGVLILIGSGLRIHHQSDWFTWLQAPRWMTLGGTIAEAQRVNDDFGFAAALMWHFFAMWLLGGALVLYLIWGLAAGHFRRSYWPFRLGEAVRNVGDFLRGRLAHDLGERNAAQRLLYAGAVVLMVVMVWSGLSIWKPVQLDWLAWPLGGYVGARIVHILGTIGMMLFVAVHLLLVALVPKVLPPMITGRARADQVAASAAEGGV